MVQTDSHYKKFREPEIPKSCQWIWGQFLYIWQNCERDFNGNAVFTFKTLNEYSECMKVHFTIVEKKLLLKIKNWVTETICSFDS